ncbi:hypothetical protein G3N95_12165 [Paraburkholderia sp. Tr-20389]|uniref:hypothetical protein n=1 Tax=Paraburkholderia sp. Tr-20389 TaxID=2703903 RepID=UPI001981B78A|nr:hypothetical protein [Paraburkholderia sp. Tr-20389]MBN3753697.1 hypothetical protein [Paraburkholderia sp. Tr-20389]
MRLLIKHAVARGMIAAAVLSMFAACKSVPDASPFAVAGSQLHSAVMSAGIVVTSGLNEAELANEAQSFSTLWQVPDQCTLAMMRYGNALANIVQATHNGDEAVQQVFDAGTKLADSLGIAVPPALAAGEVLALLKTIDREVANVVAARSLEDALSRMQPAVDNVAIVMNRELDAAGDILRNADGIVDTKLRLSYKAEVDYEQTLTKNRQALYQKALTTDTTRQLDEIVHREQVIAPVLAERQQKYDLRNTRLQTRRELINTAKQAVSNWAQAHRDLQAAVQSGGTLDLAALNESIVELRALIEKARAS